MRRTVFNGWELLRKHEYEDCGAIATRLCDKYHAIHAADPLYDTTRESDVGLLACPA